MARQVIILENQTPNRGSTDPISYRFAFWLSVPAPRQTFLANATATSVVKGLTAGELTAIQNGSIKEEVGIFQEVAGTTISQIEVKLAAAFTTRQTAINNGSTNLWDHYGTTWDGTTWTLVTVA